jgi:hypothetical protein
VGCVHRSRDLAEHVLERGVLDLRARRDVGAEEAEIEPAEAADRPEAGALVLDGVDGRGPVGADSQLLRAQLPAAAGRAKLDGNVLERVRPALEEGARLRRREPTDVDARDVDACREALRRAGERQPDDDAGQACEDDEDRRSADEKGLAGALLVPRRPAETGWAAGRQGPKCSRCFSRVPYG